MTSIVETSRIPASRSLSRHDLYLFGILAVVLVAVIGCALLAAAYPVEIDASTMQWPAP